MVFRFLMLTFLAASFAASSFAQAPAIRHGRKILSRAAAPHARTALALQLPGAPLAGGSDDCTTPDVVAGAGPFPFDTTAATTGSEGQGEALCDVATQIGINRDVWFTWTAGFSGPAELATCNQALLDTKVAVYDGTTCPTAPALACNDDACGLQSIAQWTVTAGNAYVIQLGQWGSGMATPGSFTIRPILPSVPPVNDDCSGPIVLLGPGTYALDTTLATTNMEQSFFCPDARKDVWYEYPATTTGTLTISTCGLITSTYDDTVLSVYVGPGCPMMGSMACNDNACGLQSSVSFATTCGQTYMLQIGQFGSNGNVVGSFDVAETGATCGPTGVPFCFGDGSGSACPCGNTGAPGNGCASSADPAGANLSTSGHPTLANDNLVLLGTGMPNSSCLYFQGLTQTSTPFGDGLRCAGGSIVRLANKVNSAGASQFPGPGDPPLHVKGNVVAPGMRTYQAWYRNAAAFCTPSTFNLSNGVLVDWQ